ncbi:SDR family oxidoreductase [Fervidibacillus halotolerans]|uniref:SDR family oxidoreductase n=1 Tax=Fervidibacillus halotolerans TaxID=2980027 RepID=A0A9E8S194_9BACI|nr:SDR family oxidoreductase [Fervidibacillus halotolerans]WAA13292.1 SDR family oxidoreductase [Fervidibacillus halotolerans]
MLQKTAFITGGATGIGKITAYYLAEKGCNIILNYRKSENEAKDVANELKTKFSVDAYVLGGDVASPSDCKRLYEQVTERSGGVDILIHNAGPYVRERKKMVDYQFEEWEYIVNGNLNSVFYLSKLFLPYMQKQKWGRIITLGFDRAESAPGWAFRSAFASAKSGLVSLTKTLSLEEAENGITVNMVCPGDITDEWKERTIEEARGEVDSSTPIGRPGTGEDVARVIAFLCDRSSDFLTGNVIHVSGGKDVIGKWRYSNG